jgi:hypothetical protein
MKVRRGRPDPCSATGIVDLAAAPDSQGSLPKTGANTYLDDNIREL